MFHRILSLKSEFHLVRCTDIEKRKEEERRKKKPTTPKYDMCTISQLYGKRQKTYCHFNKLFRFRN